MQWPEAERAWSVGGLCRESEAGRGRAAGEVRRGGRTSSHRPSGTRGVGCDTQRNGESLEESEQRTARSDLLSNRTTLAVLLRKDCAQAFKILLLGTVIRLAQINYKNSKRKKKDCRKAGVGVGRSVRKLIQ